MKKLYNLWALGMQTILTQLHSLSFQLEYTEDVTRVLISTLRVHITTAADDKFCDIFPNFHNYHALFVIFEKAARFETVVCCKL